MRIQGLPELLAPAGSPKALEAALNAGADAVYMGGPGFNARANAVNFTSDELKSAVRDAHSMGVKIYLTLNTLVYDREMKDFLKAAEDAYLSGVDALITADPGGAAAIHRLLPDFPLHASTQMSVHNTDASYILAGMGFQRAVLARELSRDNIRSFTSNSPLEAEIFIHGALCMSYSGQCLFSSVVGGRSGNRGECAQPCRLPYGTPDGRHYPLSLKDCCLAGHVTEIIDDGVASLKIEGRMKPAEYVGAVTAVWRSLLDEGRNATPDEIKYLADIFSRSGFTDGYYIGNISRDMLGTRTEKDKQSTEHVKYKTSICSRRLPEINIPERSGSVSGYSARRPEKRRELSKMAVFYDSWQYTQTAKNYFDIAFIPLESYKKAAADGNAPQGVILPPVITDSEKPAILSMLKNARMMGATDALIGNLGHIGMVKDTSLRMHGDFRLNITNSESAAVIENLGFDDYVLSPELTLPRIRDIGGRSYGFVYGRIPLMITEKCAGRECGGCKSCGRNFLCDRMGKKFPIKRVYPHRSVILNCLPVYMSDKPDLLFSGGIKSEYYLFTTETPAETDKIIKAFKARSAYPLNGGCRRIQSK